MSTASATLQPARAHAPELALPVAPLSGWRRLLRDTLLVGGSTALCQVLAVAGSLILRACINPAQMGVWQGLKTLLGYANYANLGISKGAARELTLAMGRGDTSTAYRGLNLAFTINTATSIIYATLLASCGGWYWFSRSAPLDRAWAVGLFALALLVILQRHLTFHVTILRSRQMFAATSKLALLDGLLTLALVSVATWLWGLFGLYAGTVLVMLVGIAFVRLNGGHRSQWAWDRAEVARLMGIGAPILAWGALSTLLQSLDKWLILAWIPDGEFQLGCYSTALLVGAQILGMGNMFALVFGPRYGEVFGRSGQSEPVAQLAMETCQIQALVLALVCGESMLLAPPILTWLLPEYHSGLCAVALLAPGAVAMSLTMPASQYLVAVCRERRLFAPLVAGLVVASGGGALAVWGGFGIRGIAWATSLSYAVYCGSLMRISLWQDLNARDRSRLARGLTLALAPTLLVAWGLGWCLDANSLGPTLILECGAVLIAWAVAAWVVWRCNGWSSLSRGVRS